MKFVLFLLAIHLALPCFAQQNNKSRGMNMDSLIALDMIDLNRRVTAPIGKAFPSFSVKNHKSVVSNKSLKGKVLLVNFWFASCHPCLEEFEGLNKLYSKLRPNKNFELISFTFEKPNIVDEIRKKYKIPYQIFSVTQEQCRGLLRGLGFPTSYIVSKSGIVKQVIFGGESTEEASTMKIMTNVYQMILKEL